MIADPAIVERRWPLTRVRIGARLGDNDVFEVEAAEGRFILKYAGSWSVRETVERTTRLLLFLRGRGFHWSPVLTPLTSGEAFCKMEGRFAYLMERTEGAPLPETPESYANLGTLLASVHAITDAPGILNPSIPPDRSGMLQSAATLPFGNEYSGLVRRLPDYQLPGLRMGLTHPDLHLGQLLRRADGGLLILDWDDAGPGRLIMDLGYPLIMNFITPSLTIRREEARAFYSLYCARSVMSSAEQLLLFDAALDNALFYLQFSRDQETAWRKIGFALAHREELIACVSG